MNLTNFFFFFLKKGGTSINADELDKAISSLSKATGVGVAENDKLKLKARNGTEMTLESVFEVAASTAAPAAPVSAPVSDLDREVLLVPAELRDKFRSYVEKLQETIYFKDVEQGTSAWSKRLVKAREKFMRKYGGGGGAPAAAASSSSAAPAAAAAASAPSPASAADQKRAEELKNAGNERLKQGDFEGAVALYSQAIDLHQSAVYYSNRAAAYQYLEKHQLALEDAQKSVQIDPKFFKGFMRIGHSLIALNRPQQAIDEGFEPALTLQPNDQSAKEGLAAARASVVAMSSVAEEMAANPAIGRMAEQVAAGGGGGIPGLEQMMNPEMMRMAMEAMSNWSFLVLLCFSQQKSIIQGIRRCSK